MSGQYIISKCSSGWAIAVDGAIVLVCKRKAVAQRIVRDVTACDTAAVTTTDSGCMAKPVKPPGGGKPLTPHAT
jgi:hypothetical protein